MRATTEGPDVFTIAEIARAAGVSQEAADPLFAGRVLPRLRSGFVAQAEAVDAVRLLRMRQPARQPAELFEAADHPQSAHGLGRPLLASGAAHAAVVGSLLILTSLGLAAPMAPEQPVELKAARLVFLAMPGPGGGGGGGGLKAPKPAAKAALKGKSSLRSPVPPARTVRSNEERTKPVPAVPPPAPEPAEKPTPPPPPVPHADPTPPVTAPVAPVAADPVDRAGVLNEAAPDKSSRGPGTGGGTGTGAGTGSGEGTGSGLGEGSGGGTGGGPYRPGAGITPPELLREVRPAYTEEARRRNLEGEVVLEIVVRRDGTVSNLRVMRGLGAGLDQRAIDAVRQWRFSPARRYGTPVDVMVEVAVEFRLR